MPMLPPLLSEGRAPSPHTPERYTHCRSSAPEPAPRPLEIRSLRREEGSIDRRVFKREEDHGMRLNGDVNVTALLSCAYVRMARRDTGTGERGEGCVG